ncbi:hypothetical protein ACFW08_16360 [Streptomyces sp. NPDC058960]
MGGFTAFAVVKPPCRFLAEALPPSVAPEPLPPPCEPLPPPCEPPL